MFTLAWSNAIEVQDVKEAWQHVHKQDSAGAAEDASETKVVEAE